MSRRERAEWDARFREGSHAEEQPDPFLISVEKYSGLFNERRRAFDVPCGAGRNAVWLAEHGWEVTGCDISLEGLRRAQSLAQSRGVRLDLLCADLGTFAWPQNHFDLLICFFYLQRKLFANMKAALGSGGVVVYKTYTTEQLRFQGGPRHPMHLLRPQELLQAFREFRVLFYQETAQDRGVAQIIAQKP